MTDIDIGGSPMVASRGGRGHRWLLGITSVVLLLAVGSRPAPAQNGAPDSVTLIPGLRYRASGLHRFLFGATYRDLWTTKITVPVLRLGDSTGGLTPTEKGGGRQTQALRFTSGDG